MTPDFNSILNDFAAQQRLGARVSQAAEQDAAEMAVIHWEAAATGVKGHGSPILRSLATSMITDMNRDYPDLRHWLEAPPSWVGPRTAAQREADESAWNKAHGIEGCTCDRDPLGFCPHHKSEYTPDCLWDVVLADCLADCEESNFRPEPTIADFEKAVSERAADTQLGPEITPEPETPFDGGTA